MASFVTASVGDVKARARVRIVPPLPWTFDMEGLKVWQPGRTSGYAVLERACERFGVLDGWLATR